MRLRSDFTSSNSGTLKSFIQSFIQLARQDAPFSLLQLGSSFGPNYEFRMRTLWLMSGQHSPSISWSTPHWPMNPPSLKSRGVPLSDEVPTAHHPNVLALSVFQALRERTDGAIEEFNTSRHGCRRRLSRKYVVAIELRAHTQTQIVCLPAQQLRVDGLHESSHPV